MRFWYQRHKTWQAICLTPLSLLYALASCCRRWLYRRNILRVHHFNVPIIVVGNIAIGGTGKTPLVIALTRYLVSQGYRPGIISRGYRAAITTFPYEVKLTDLAAAVGDEPLLIARATEQPVVIARKRYQAVHYLLDHHQCDVIISDDGLQHYALDRTVEIAVVDGERQFGNQLLLPAGPLREPLTRLTEVDFVVVNHREGLPTASSIELAKVAHTIMSSENHSVYQLIAPDQREQLPPSWQHETVHAVAGIGNPQAFFKVLTQLGFDIIPHAFSDHHAYQPSDFVWPDPDQASKKISLTEKDAIKCLAFADQRFWVVALTVKLPESFYQQIKDSINQLDKRGQEVNDD